jgi:hypothetical protein
VQRLSAKHGVKDDFAFLWEHAILRHPPKKNPLTDRSDIFAQLITSARPLNMPKMVTIGWVGAAPHIGEI